MLPIVKIPAFNKEIPNHISPHWYRQIRLCDAFTLRSAQASRQSFGSVAVTPFLDLVMVWNRGISYGLFQQGSALGQILLAGFAVVAVVALTLWLARMTSLIGAAGAGLVMGGAVGNAIDRLVHGAVADFFSFHAWDFYWYVFNVADAAIVAGVAGLMYDSIFNSHKKVSKTS
jgi:signal peptidase II